MIHDHQTEKTAKELETERGRQIQRAIADEANQFEKDFYAALRGIGYRINNASQLHPSKFGYNKNIIPVFEVYLKKAESIKAYYHIGSFSNYVQLMLHCIASPKLKEMTPFMVERYQFAVTHYAPSAIIDGYKSTIFYMRDKKYLGLYRMLLKDDYLSFGTSSIIGIFDKFKVYDIEDRLIELLGYRAELEPKRKYKESGKAFYALGCHLNVCAACIRTLGHFKSQKALPYIQEYLIPENKLEYDSLLLTQEEYNDIIKRVREIAEKAVSEIEKELKG